MSNPVNLGNCIKCQNKLAVVKRNKFRVAGDSKILLDEDGKDLRQDPQGRLTGRPAYEWVVSCPDCGRDCRDHPYQKELDEAAAKQKAATPPAPAFLGNTANYTEINGMDAMDRRVTALESALSLTAERLEKRIAELGDVIGEVREMLASRPSSEGETRKRREREKATP